MVTATLRSILESIAYQIVNVNTTEIIPSQRKGEENAPLKKTNISENVTISNQLSGRVLFLKQNWVRVSRISVKRRNRIILGVSVFFNTSIVFIIRALQLLS